MHWCVQLLSLMSALMAGFSPQAICTLQPCMASSRKDPCANANPGILDGLSMRPLISSVGSAVLRYQAVHCSVEASRHFNADPSNHVMQLTIALAPVPLLLCMRHNMCSSGADLQTACCSLEASARFSMVQRFNTYPSNHVMLLTTNVIGLFHSLLCLCCFAWE